MIHFPERLSTSERKQTLGEPKREELKVRSQNAILVAILNSQEKGLKSHALDEIQGLVETAGANVVGTMVQVREHPDPATYIGKGKLNELKQLIAASDANLIVFDNPLSPAQGKHIEDETNTLVVDRSEVILDIFATHARTHESKLQVELAQLQYMRPRLKRMWTHLERTQGGIDSGRGPGEKQLETDRRLIDKRISELQRKLAVVEDRRERLVASRKGHLTVSLVGYTNSGKSTLMRALTGADVYVADQLFATLDTRTRKWTLPHCGDVLLSDTVGFVRNLPHHLVASFKSTLEEARHADLLLHVVDASHPEAERHIVTVNSVLKEIGAADIDSLLVLNKIDRIEDHSLLDVLRAHHPHAVSTSARAGIGLDRLSAAVAERLAQGYMNIEVETSIANGRLQAYLAANTEVLGQQFDNGTMHLTCRIPQRLLPALRKFEATIRNERGEVLRAPSSDDEPD